MDSEPQRFHEFYKDEMAPLFVPRLKLHLDNNGHHKLLKQPCNNSYLNLEGNVQLQLNSLYACPALQNG